MHIETSKRAIFNVSNIIKGGALQAAVNFIVTSKDTNSQQFDWYYILSKEVNEELKKSSITMTQNVLIVNDSPSHSKKIKNQILAFEQTNMPDIVFTLFGPCYIKFNSLHITGFANGWVTHATLSTFLDTFNSNIPIIIKSLLKYCYYAFHIRQANGWVFETDTAKQGFIKRLKVPANQCHVVANTSISFDENFIKVKETTINNVTLNYADNLFIALAADYPQKNLLSLLTAANHLKRRLKELHFKIIFTLPTKTFNNNFLPEIIRNNLQEYCINIGKIDVVDLSKLYSVAYASILPSFIETFSAVYPESFATKTPIITSNKPFAQEICKDAALYIDPKNPEEIAQAIKLLINDKNKYKQLANQGSTLYSEMLTPKEKFQHYIEVLTSFLK
jgi:glycosyltransferase involved in cell wall biosynthesis